MHPSPARALADWTTRRRRRRRRRRCSFPPRRPCMRGREGGGPDPGRDAGRSPHAPCLVRAHKNRAWMRLRELACAQAPGRPAGRAHRAAEPRRPALAARPRRPERTGSAPCLAPAAGAAAPPRLARSGRRAGGGRRRMIRGRGGEDMQGALRRGAGSCGAASQARAGGQASTPDTRRGAAGARRGEFQAARGWGSSSRMRSCANKAALLRPQRRPDARGCPAFRPRRISRARPSDRSRGPRPQT